VTKEVADQLSSKSSHGVIETGHRIDSQRKKTEYNRSELRLLETLENVCSSMMDYRVHKERPDSTRWAKSMSQTFKTLHGLVGGGGSFDLGKIIGVGWYNKAANPRAQKLCETFIEDNEDDVNSWYFGTQENSLQDALCQRIVKNKICLSEPYGQAPQDLPEPQEETNKKKASKKGDTGKKKHKKVKSEL
ncbi:unnamed protein product, partial [Meganyctiphanes norvegica]